MVLGSSAYLGAFVPRFSGKLGWNGRNHQLAISECSQALAKNEFSLFGEPQKDFVNFKRKTYPMVHKTSTVFYTLSRCK